MTARQDKTCNSPSSDASKQDNPCHSLSSEILPKMFTLEQKLNIALSPEKKPFGMQKTTFDTSIDNIY